ncbi:phasin family protein [Proteiniclasticum sp. C24MP]|uniref:phasin family protein n=1 Tax=Proteiniclasticum sp. C24MP TaxID=3374101 RepID=UPI003754C40A
MEELKKLLLSAVGAAAISVEKIDSTVTELIEKGKLSVKESKELREELVRRKKESEEDLVKKEDLNEIIDSLNLISKRELELLEERVAKLEEQMRTVKDTDI